MEEGIEEHNAWASPRQMRASTSMGGTRPPKTARIANVLLDARITSATSGHTRHRPPHPERMA